MIELANALSEDVDVVLMLPENHRLTPKHVELIRSTVNFIPFTLVLHRSIRDNGRMLLTILRAIWEEKPDVLHVQSNGHRLFHLIAPLLPSGTRVVNTVHDPTNHPGDQRSEKIDDRAVRHRAKRFTDRFIVHGESLLPRLCKEYGVEEAKVSVIPHGNFGIYRKFAEGDLPETDYKNVLFFGRIWRYKGLQYFIDAANRIIDERDDVVFTIAGEGESLENYAFDEDKLGQFRIINRRVSLPEAAEIFAEASFVVLPYIEASQSGVIPLAYAFGKPVVATNVGALSEVVVQGETGFLVSPGHIDELT